MVLPPFFCARIYLLSQAQNKKGAAGVNLLTRPGLVAIMCEVRSRQPIAEDCAERALNVAG